MMPGQLLELSVVVLSVLTCSVVGTYVVRCLGLRYGWVAPPREDRWHKKATALHGGVGFYPAFLLGAAWVITQQFGGELPQFDSFDGISTELRLTAALLLGSFLMFLFGLLDDLKHCRPSTKLIAQLVAASMFIFAGGVFPLTGIQLLDILVTYFWFIGIINAVNMLDNMDGLSSGVVILAGTTLIILAMQGPEIASTASLVVLLGSVFVAAVLGFWVFNRSPSTIFMGDSGSLFIGFVLAAMAVPSPLNGFMGIGSAETVLGPVMALLIPATVLAIPIFDTTLVTVTRAWRAQKASLGGRDHSSHRMVGLGLSERNTVWLLYSFSAFGGAVAILMQGFPAQALPLLGIFALILIFTGVYLGHVKVRTTEPGRLPPSWTPLVSQILYKRRAAEVVLDTTLIILCFYGAYLLRFEGVLSPLIHQAMVSALPIVVASCLVSFFVAGVYRGQWRLISVSDVPGYAIAVFGGAALSLAIVTLLARLSNGHSASAYIIFAVLLFIAVVGSRLSFRILESLVHQLTLRTSAHGRRPVLIYGAAQAGKVLYEEITSNPEVRNYVVLGFVDDDLNRVGRRLCGVPVKKGSEWIRQPWDRPPEIWISSRFISDQRAQELARHWNGQSRVCRVKLRVEAVENHDEPSIVMNPGLTGPPANT